MCVTGAGRTPPAPLLLHEPMGGELTDRLANRRPADSHLLGNTGIRDPLAWEEPAREDRLAQVHGDELDE